MDDLAAIALRRLGASRLAGAPFARPEDVVAWHGAIQAQEYAAARWGLGRRLRSGTDAGVAAACDEGRILRTHVLRPTWHFVLPADVRWLLALTAPRVGAALTSYERKLELTPAVQRRASAAIERALAPGRPLTRPELGAAIERAGVATGGLRLGFLTMRAELDALIVSGPRRGKQFTYVPFDARVPPSPPRPRDEALAALAARYVASHGPAQATDLAWWGGLTVADARAGLEAHGRRLERVEVEGRTFWLDPATPPARPRRPAVRLLPAFDEAVVAYRDHTASLDPALRGRKLFLGPLDRNLVAIDGQVVGGWRSPPVNGEAVVEARLLRRLSAPERAALLDEVARYGRFMGAPARLASPSVTAPPRSARTPARR